MSGGTIAWYPIGAGQHAGGEIEHARAMGAHIGALVVEEDVLDPEDAAIGIDRGAHLMALLARMIGGDEMLVAILDPLDGAAQPQRAEAGQHVLGVKLAAHAKAAADMALVEMHR